MKRKVLSLLAALLLILSLCVLAFAAASDTGFSDVDAGAWYADAAVYVRDNGIINGMEGNRFAPKSNATRAQVATILRNFLTKEMPSTPDKSGKILIAYFTVPETSGADAVSSASRVVDNGEVVGNVEFIARAIPRFAERGKERHRQRRTAGHHRGGG